MAVFVLTRINGPNYDQSLPRREQAGWREHASFMDGLLAEGFVLLGGPLADGQHVLLVVEAADEQEVTARLADDPWEPTGILVTGSMQRWELWLDGRAAVVAAGSA